MKSRKNLLVAFLLLLACAAVTISFESALVASHSVLSARAQAAVNAQPSVHLVDTSFHPAAFLASTPVFRGATSHNPTPETGVAILPDHSLLVNNINVVEDPNLTWDPCIGGTQSGAWTFDTLMMAIRNGTRQQAEQMLTNMLASFGADMTVNGFTTKARPLGTQFFDDWPRDPNNMCNGPNGPQACLSLDGPVHLNAIVNRIDIRPGVGAPTPGGELRFVFGVTAIDGGGQNGLPLQCDATAPLFNIILEYNVPSGITAQTWGQDWQNLSTLCPKGLNDTTCAQGTFDPALRALTNQVVLAGEGGPGTPNGSALADVRTNEVALHPEPPLWELRQFLFSGIVGAELKPTQPSQTPDLSFDAPFCSDSNQNPPCNSNLATIETYIQNNESCIINGTCTFQQKDPLIMSFSALNPLLFWNSNPSMQGSGLHQARVIFAASPQFFDSDIGSADPVGGIDGTCNGCHGQETQTAFQQIVNRDSAPGFSNGASNLSGFLVGCNNGGATLTEPCPQMTTGCGGSQNPCVFPLNTPGTEVVQDPVDNSALDSKQNTFGDIERRVSCLNKIATQGSVNCDGAGH